MKLKEQNTEALKKESRTVRKFNTANDALKSKHDLARAFFKNINLPN